MATTALAAACDVGRDREEAGDAAETSGTTPTKPGGRDRATACDPTEISTRADVGFGRDGIVRTDFGARDRAAAVAVLPNGKIVVAGSSGRDIALVRYLPDGHVDSTLGHGGRMVADFHGDRVSAVAIEPNRGVIAVGPKQGKLALARYRPDGVRDRSFGRSGEVVTDVGGKARLESTWVDPRKWVTPSALAVQADGTIVVTGASGTEVMVVRYTRNGRLDRRFGASGIVHTMFGGGDFSYATDVVVQPDGAIVVAAESGPSPGLGLIHYARDGSDGDLTFGDWDATWDATLAVQPDGRVVAGGEQFDFSTGAKAFTVVRYTRDGRRDPTFDLDGEVLTDRVGRGSLIAIGPASQIVVAGSGRGRFEVMCYSGDGILGQNFGRAERPRAGRRGLYEPMAIAFQRDGKIVVAGSVRGDFVVARYEADGTLDS